MSTKPQCDTGRIEALENVVRLLVDACNSVYYYDGKLSADTDAIDNAVEAAERLLCTRGTART